MPEPTVSGTLPFVIETRYQLVPAGAEAGSGARAPLVVLLHGQGMSGAAIRKLAGLSEGGPRHLLLPDGIYPGEQRRAETIRIGFSWYMYSGDQQHFRAELERGEAHVLRLIDQVSRTHAVDERRVTLVGYSQGGYLAGFVALRNRSRVRGLIIAGSRLKHEFLADELAAGGLPAVLFLHSEADTSVRWELAEPGVAALTAAGARVTVERHDEGHRMPKDFGPRVERWLDANEL